MELWHANLILIGSFAILLSILNPCDGSPDFFETVNNIESHDPPFYYFGDLLKPPESPLKRKNGNEDQGGEPSDRNVCYFGDSLRPEILLKSKNANEDQGGEPSSDRDWVTWAREPKRSAVQNIIEATSTTDFPASSTWRDHERTSSSKGKESLFRDTPFQYHIASSSTGETHTKDLGQPGFLPQASHPILLDHPNLTQLAKYGKNDHSVTPTYSIAEQIKGSLLPAFHNSPQAEEAIDTLQHPYIFTRKPPELSRITTSFTKSLDQIKLPSSKGSAISSIKNLPVRCEDFASLYEFREGDEIVSVIRILNKSRVPVSLKHLSRSLHHLLCWIYYSHGKLMKELRLLIDQDELQRPLLRWLYMQVFGSTDRLPVVGRLLKDGIYRTHGGFGTVQEELIRYLAEDGETVHSHRVSIYIIGQWYQHFEPETLPNESENQSDFPWFEFGKIQNALLSKP